MSFSDTFQKTLSLKDVNNIEDVDIFSNSPLVANKIKNLPKELGVTIPSLDSVKTKGNKFAELAIETIEKINKNPFWDEYPKDSKEKISPKEK